RCRGIGISSSRHGVGTERRLPSSRAHVDRLYVIANRILRHTGLAEDAAQQSLVAIWRELPSLRDPDRFEAWATRIVVNECGPTVGRCGSRRVS
ncbi:MAG TPA: sigma factor, partial [Candidatus Limnocylindrales bacterium]|nr:sigma factor [Candidatus Limnocylindrales bacterium]